MTAPASEVTVGVIGLGLMGSALKIKGTVYLILHCNIK